MKTKQLRITFLVVALAASSAGAQNAGEARELLRQADFDGASAALEGRNKTAEVRVLRAMTAMGFWFEADLNGFLKSTGAEASAVDAVTDAGVYRETGGSASPLPKKWVRAEAVALNHVVADGQRSYSLPPDQANRLVLVNRAEEPVSVDFEADLASDSDRIDFLLNGEWFGYADTYGRSFGWGYQGWNDGTLEKSFSLTLDPGDRLGIRHFIQASEAGDGAPTRLRFPQALVSGGQIEVQTGEYDRYYVPGDPLNAFFTSDPVEQPTEDAGRRWRESGTIVPDSTANAPIPVDLWLSLGDVFNDWSEEGKCVTFAYDGPEPRQLDFLIALKNTWPDFGGRIFLNGLEIGELRARGLEWRFDGPAINLGGEVGANASYTLSVPVEPGDRLSLCVSRPGYTWYSPDPGEENDPFLGIGYDAAIPGLSVENGVPPVEPFPRFAPGFETGAVAGSFFGDSEAFASLLTDLIAELDPVQPTADPVVLTPAETGFSEEVRIATADVELLLAGMKLLRGFQILASMRELGGVPLTLSALEPYFSDPIQFWDDYPDLLTLVQTRSGEGSVAKRFFEEAIAHYRGVADDFWSRESGIGWRYLFEIDPLADISRTDVGADIDAFEASLTGYVALDAVDPAADGTKAASLAPLLSASPPGFRGLIPRFDEYGFFQGGSGPLLASGLLSGFSAFEVDRALFDAGVLALDIQRSLAGKVLVGYAKDDTTQPSQYQEDPSVIVYFATDTELYLQSGDGSTAFDYDWDPGVGELRVPASGDRLELEFSSGSGGRYLGYWNGQWGEGRYVLLDAGFDLDRNGRADGRDVRSGQYRALRGLENAGDWDGDFLDDDAETGLGTDPMRIDTDGDGLDDWLESSIFDTNPSNVNGESGERITSSIQPRATDWGKAFVLEFPATAGETYHIQYAESPEGPWNTVFPSITPRGSRVQWGDAGPPATQTSPGDTPRRFYRILEAESE